jgi:predicted nuclease of restriction endonuclease-like (RecB) superfamily
LGHRTLDLERQQHSGWGAKIIDRLACDLRDAYPDMKGFSPRNLKYMRAFSAAWPDRAIVQAPLAQITWYHNIALLEKVSTEADRLEVGDQDFYVDLLFYHLKLRRYVIIELKAVPFAPEFVGQMNLYLSAADDLLRHADDKPSIGLLLCRSKDKVVVEYALRNLKRPLGVAEWETAIVEKLPRELQASLPTVEEIEAELDSLQDE